MMSLGFVVRSFLCCFLGGLLAVSSGLCAPPQMSAQAAKAQVKKLGIGEKVKVDVFLKDGSKVRGYISAIHEDGLTVVSDSSEEQIQYDSVAKVKRRGLSTAAKVLIIGGGAVLGVGVIAAAMCSGGCN